MSRSQLLLGSAWATVFIGRVYGDTKSTPVAVSQSVALGNVLPFPLPSAFPFISFAPISKLANQE